jgi:hypothetical protein
MRRVAGPASPQNAVQSPDSSTRDRNQSNLHFKKTNILSLHVGQPIPNILVKQRLPILVPSAECWPPLRHVTRAPHNAQLVHRPSRFIIRADNVELAQARVIQHVEDRFFRTPSAGRFLTSGPSRQPCKGPSRTAQME